MLEPHVLRIYAKGEPMRQATRFMLAGALLLIFMIVAGANPGDKTQRAYALQATGTPESEIPGETQLLEVGKTLTESLSQDTSIHFYRFTGKADQKFRVSVEPKPGADFFTSISITGDDLQSILGGTVGEALVSGSVVIKLPTDGAYFVMVEYADSTVGTPTPGSYDITLSEVK